MVKLCCQCWYIYLNFFDTVDFNTLTQILLKIQFSKTLLHPILDYLLNRTHFVQIDSLYSSDLYSNFGALQRSILEPVFSVADMSNSSPICTCLQYADDSTVYQNCRVKDLERCCVNAEKDLSKLLNWSADNCLQCN